MAKKYKVTSNIRDKKDSEQFVSNLGKELYLLLKLNRFYYTGKGFSKNGLNQGALRSEEGRRL